MKGSSLALTALLVSLNCQTNPPNQNLESKVEPVNKKSAKTLKTSTRVESFEFEGIKYRSVTVAPENLKVMLNDENGDGLKTFENVRKTALARFSRAPKAIMNAGIFEPGERPTGLHIENYKLLSALNLRDGKGNFFTKPNGVFYVDKTPHILSSEDYAKKKRKPRLAIQSGPLLMKRRKIMKHFSRNNPSRKVRNGVCTRGKQSIFLISIPGPKLPNMYDFAHAFADLGCTDALYLDGTISALAVDGESLGWRQNFAGFFVFY